MPNKRLLQKINEGSFDLIHTVDGLTVKTPTGDYTAHKDSGLYLGDGPLAGEKFTTASGFFKRAKAHSINLSKQKD